MLGISAGRKRNQCSPTSYVKPGLECLGGGTWEASRLTVTATVVAAAAVVFNFATNYHIKYFGQQREHVEESTPDLKDF